jgi:hypothetical protein
MSSCQPDLHGPAAQDRVRGRAWQLDRRRGAFAVSPSAAIRLMQRVRATRSAAPERYGGTGGLCSTPTEPTSTGSSRRCPTSSWPNARPSCSGAAACGPGRRPSTTRSAAPACGIKKRSLRAAEQDPRATSPASAGCGALGSATWTRPGSSSSTRPAPPPIWHGATAAVRSESASGRAARPLAHHDLHRRAQADRHRGAAGAGGSMAGLAFRAYVEQCLVPALAPSDVVMLDNLAAHKIDASARRSLRPLPRSSTSRRIRRPQPD